MREFYEISDRYIEAGEANDLLYEPVAQGLSYQKTCRYEFVFDDHVEALTEFVRATLFDEISQELHQGTATAFPGALFVLDYGIKPGALDLEKETVLAYYKELDNPGFDLEELIIRQRIYIFGEAAPSVSERFIRDICNAAVHNWSVI